MKKQIFNTTVHLSEAGGQHLEFIYLADLTNDLDMKAKVRKARTFLQNSAKQLNNGLYMHEIDVITGVGTSHLSSIFWPSSTFYQCLIKSYVQSNEQDEQAIEMYRDAIDAVLNNSVIQKSAQNHLTYAVAQSNNKFSTDYNGCYLGAMLALGADAMQRKLGNRADHEQQTRITQHWLLAVAITERCHSAANKTKLAKAAFNDMDEYGHQTEQAMTFENTAAIAESYFVLWRLTHQSKYRDYAWKLAQAIHKHCRTEDGKYYQFGEMHKKLHFYNTEEENTKLNFVSTTLKYIYLTFSDDSVLPLDQWVFNKVAQPLPICGKNAAYPAEKCA